MRPRIEYIHSNLDQGQLPSDPQDCWVVVSAAIGAEGEAGADVFTFYVCTLQRLKRVLTEEKVLFGRHLILVERFDWDQVEEAIRSLLSGMEAENWEKLGRKLGLYGQWEFEDFVEDFVPFPPRDDGRS